MSGTLQSTWSTDDYIDQICSLARTALGAYNTQRARQGYPTTGGYDDQRFEAQTRILKRLRQRGIQESMITRPSDLYETEAALALVILFQYAQQFAKDGSGDVYSVQALRWAEEYESQFNAAAPIENVRSEAASFEIGRG